MSLGIDPRHLETLENCNFVGNTLLQDGIQEGLSIANLHLVNLL